MDFWNSTGFEVHEGEDYAGMEIMPDGSLEINVREGTIEDRDGYERDHDAILIIPAERVPEVLVGIQIWIEQLGENNASRR